MGLFFLGSKLLIFGPLFELRGNFANFGKWFFRGVTLLRRGVVSNFGKCVFGYLPIFEGVE